ncbi:hypothetical protein B0H13DRAFT_2474027 [Mycena leptocephala]|nr:hypothetical protein B0H13DRAFT_2474027 [Mycena leptocephala]
MCGGLLFGVCLLFACGLECGAHSHLLPVPRGTDATVGLLAHLEARVGWRQKGYTDGDARCGRMAMETEPVHAHLQVDGGGGAGDTLVAEVEMERDTELNTLAISMRACAADWWRGVEVESELEKHAQMRWRWGQRPPLYSNTQANIDQNLPNSDQSALNVVADDDDKMFV